MIRSSNIGVPIGTYKPCEADGVLSQAMSQSGINPFDGSSNIEIWKCDKAALTAGCPDTNVTCYSNSLSRSSALCFNAPQMKVVQNGNDEIMLPTFNKLYLFSNTHTGAGSKLSSWETDPNTNRCSISSATIDASPTDNSNHAVLTPENCRDLVKAAIGGGSINSENPKLSKDRFCDSSKVKDPEYTKMAFARLLDLARCNTAFPQLLDSSVTRTATQNLKPIPNDSVK